MKFTIIKDTREQTGWDFLPTEHCEGMEIGTLKTGDYTIKGSEDLICIERKCSVEEIANNLGKNYTTFSKEIKRMESFRHAFIICEFGMTELINYPKFSKLPPWLKKQIRLKGPFLLKRLNEIQLTTNVKVLLCDSADNAQEAASSIFKILSADND